MLSDLRAAALREELAAVRGLPARYEASIAGFVAMSERRAAETEERRAAVRALLQDTAAQQRRAWTGALQRVARLWEHATGILGDVLDRARLEHSQQVCHPPRAPRPARPCGSVR
jgi:hypothetical protein